MVPGSTFRYGSSFTIEMRMPRDSRIAAREAAAMPLPREETTPPVTKMNLVIRSWGIVFAFYSVKRVNVEVLPFAEPLTGDDGVLNYGIAPLTRMGLQTMATRAAFFVSDRTGITAEMLGHSLLTQFESVRFQEVTLP